MNAKVDADHLHNSPLLIPSYAMLYATLTTRALQQMDRAFKGYFSRVPNDNPR